MKKIIFLFAITVCILGTSCSNDSEVKTSQVDFQSIEAKAKLDFYGTQTKGPSVIPDSVKELAIAKLQQDFKIVQNSTPEDLFKERNLNPKIVDALILYPTYKNEKNVLEILAQKTGLSDSKDIYTLAQGIEVYKYYESSVVTTKGRKLNCSMAVVGSVLTTLGACTIESGWGLGLFLAGKAVALYSMATC